ncbi:glycosyl transferase family protein [Jannaschia marina]|uniref:glycosyl transferase family protein n=1 Tax=Jannaschia marina TaxID=2741674 RepID=UPI0015CA9614|nr:glycosyl transferase family protein [Jannaschia marina]
MSLAAHIRTLGRGPSRARNLTQEEARDAMAEILSGRAAREAVGALLMLMRFHGETAAEVAGFTEAMRATLGPCPRPALDWPSYAAGRSRGAPLFLLSARLVAAAGHPVLIHGWNSHQAPIASVRAHLGAADITFAETPATAEVALKRDDIAYLPLEAFAPEALALLKLREVLGLRSVVNTVCRMLNPGNAPAAVQGVFHPTYRGLQQDAAALLGLRDLSVLKGGGGEFERHPDKPIQLTTLRAGQPGQMDLSPLTEGHRRLGDRTIDLAALWSGETRDPFAEDVVTGTAALALETLGHTDALADARRLWAARTPSLVA